MGNRRLRVWGAAAAVLAGGVVGGACSGGERPEVMGVQVTRATTSTTSTPDPASAPGTTVVTAAPTTAPTTVPATAPPIVVPTTSAPPPTAGRGESLAPGTYDERADATGSLQRQPDGSWTSTSATQVENPPPPERVRFEVSIGTPEADGAPVRVELRNTSGRTMGFPEGLQVLLRCSEDGRPWHDLTLEDPAVVELPPGATVVRSITMPLGDGTTYDCGGDTRIQLV